MLSIISLRDRFLKRHASVSYLIFLIRLARHELIDQLAQQSSRFVSSNSVSSDKNSNYRCKFA